MMLSFHSTVARCRRQMPSGMRLVRSGWLCIACVATSVAQETPPRAGLAGAMTAPGEVVGCISIRVTADLPRFVVAARVVEEAMGEAGQNVGALANNSSAPLEPPPEIVTYFSRTAQQYIAQVDRVCRLSQHQKSKLELAADGDMSRLARESRELREKYAGKVLRNQHQDLAVFEDVSALNIHLSEGVLRDGSMFLMVLKSQLSLQQRLRLAEVKFAEQTIAWPIELSDEQSQQLWRLVLRTHQREDLPLLWSPKKCRELVAALSAQELVSILGEPQADALRRWQPR